MGGGRRGHNIVNPLTGGCMYTNETPNKKMESLEMLQAVIKMLMDGGERALGRVYMSWCCALHCSSVVQCVAVFAVWCSMLQCTSACCTVLQCFAVFCSLLQYFAVCCSVLQCVLQSILWSDTV